MSTSYAQPRRQATSLLGNLWAVLAAVVRSVDAQTDALKPIVIHDATVIDVRTGDVRPGLSVLVEGRRIARLGPSAMVHVPAGARVINARGKYLVPGLIDTHVHLFRPWNRNWPDTLAQLGWILATGVTAVRDAGGAGLEPSYVAIRAGIDSGRIIGPRIRISGFVQAVMRGEKLPTMSAALGRFHALGLDQVKVSYMRRDETLETIRAARAAGVPVYGHTWEDYADSNLESTSFALAAVRAGISGLSHNRYRMVRDTLLPNAGPRMSRESTPAEILAVELYGLGGWLTVDTLSQRTLIDAMLAHGTWYEPTLGAGFPPICTPPVDYGLLLRYFPFDTKDPMATPTPAQVDTIRRACDGKRQFVKRFYDAGVRIVTGSDNAGFSPLGVPREMRHLAEAGIPPLGVLQAATINAARALEMDRDIGTIEEGKLADLVLLEANPLTDITNIGRIAVLVADGRVVDRERLLARIGTNPPMVIASERLDRLDDGVRALALQRPDTIIEVFVHTDGTMRPGDERGVAPTHSPVSIVSIDGRILRLRMPAFATRIMSRIRFVTRVALADTLERR